MAASERFIMMVEPNEKADWMSRARSNGLSTAEFVRRAVAAYEPDLDPSEIKELGLLAEQIRESTGRMEAKLDEAIALLREANDPGRDAQLRSKVEAELAAHPFTLDFSSIQDRAA